MLARFRGGGVRRPWGILFRILGYATRLLEQLFPTPYNDGKCLDLPAIANI